MLSEGSQEGMEVRVLRSDGTAFNEHNVVHRPGRPGHPPTTTCWLEIEQNVTFCVDIRLHEAILDRYHAGHYCYDTRIDGLTIDSVHDDDTEPADRNHTVSQLTFRGPERDMIGELKFTHLQTVEESINATRRINNDDDTSIQVDIEAGTRGPEEQGTCLQYTYDHGTDGGVVLEEEAKRTDTSVIASNSRPDVETKGKGSEWLPLDDQNPYRRFIFKYRSRAILEYLDIVKPELPTTSELDTATQDGTQLGQSQGTQSGDGSIPSQQEMHKSMIDMRREIHELRNTVRRQERERARGVGEVVDLTGDGSD